MPLRGHVQSGVGIMQLWPLRGKPGFSSWQKSRNQWWEPIDRGCLGGEVLGLGAMPGAETGAEFITGALLVVWAWAGDWRCLVLGMAVV